MHNNIFYRNDGGAVDLIRDAEANWSAGSALIAGSNNWVPQGAAHVPNQWADTFSGTDPGFVAFNTGDLRLAQDSPLIDAGAPTPAGLPGYPFPNPMPTPTRHPPLHQMIAVDTAESRPDDGLPDIGAYEAGAGAGADTSSSPGTADGTTGSGGGCLIDALLVHQD